MEIYFETANPGIKPDKNARDIVTFGTSTKILNNLKN